MFNRRNILAEARQEIINNLHEELDRMAQVERLAETMVRIKALEGEITLLKARLSWANSEIERLTNLQPSSSPLYWTEEEEDAQYLYKSGRIDKKQYEDMLVAAGLNPHVDLAPEDRLAMSFPS